MVAVMAGALNGSGGDDGEGGVFGEAGAGAEFELVELAEGPLAAGLGAAVGAAGEPVEVSLAGDDLGAYGETADGDDGVWGSVGSVVGCGDGVGAFGRCDIVTGDASEHFEVGDGADVEGVGLS